MLINDAVQRSVVADIAAPLMPKCSKESFNDRIGTIFAGMLEKAESM